jgi:hypothetical protein
MRILARTALTAAQGAGPFNGGGTVRFVNIDPGACEVVSRPAAHRSPKAVTLKGGVTEKLYSQSPYSIYTLWDM